MSEQNADDLRLPLANAPPFGAAPPPAPPTRREALPFLSVVVPALNEEAYIEACLLSLLAQWDEERLEILVLDGGSADGTAAIVEAVARRHPCVRLVHNPKRIQAAAVNRAARMADPRAVVLARADAHALYPQGFLRRCVGELLRTGATSVVVPMRNEAKPGARVQRAIALAQSSRLGNGGSAHRVGARSGFVEHGHHAVFDRAFFLSLGGYDEAFTHNEDAEFDRRAAEAGGQAWMCADAPVVYFPRTTLRALARQYFLHGRGRARTLLKHRLWPHPRQAAPVVVVGGLGGGAALAPVAPELAAPVLLYPALCFAWAGAQALARRDPALLASGAALVTMHVAWGVGFLRAALGAAWGGARPAALPAAQARAAADGGD